MKNVIRRSFCILALAGALFSPSSFAAGQVSYLLSQEGYVLAGINNGGGFGFYSGTDEVIPTALHASLSGCVPIQMSVDSNYKIWQVIYNEGIAKKTATSCPTQ